MRSLMDDLIFAIANTGAHAIECGGELSNLVALIDIHRDRVVTALDPLRIVCEPAERLRNTARKERGHRNRQQEGDGGEHDDLQLQ